MAFNSGSSGAYRFNLYAPELPLLEAVHGEKTHDSGIVRRGLFAAEDDGLHDLP